MIQFPIGLKEHKMFDHSGRLFVADIEGSCVFEVSNVVSDILGMCENSTTLQVRETLGLKYHASEINDAFSYLYQLQMAGILFHQMPVISQEYMEFSGRIVIAPSFLNQLAEKPFLTRVTYHHLFRALSRELEVFIPISNAEEFPGSFDWEGITPLNIPTEVGQSLTRYYPDKCHGLLSLPHSSIHDISLAYSAEIPTIYYVSGDELDRQMLLDKFFLLRDCDMLCVDSWCSKDYLSKFAPDTEKVVVLPVGVDTELYTPKNRKESKLTLAEAFENERMKSDPLILLFLPNTSYENRNLVHFLACKHPEFQFIIVGGIDRFQLGSQCENIEYFQVEDITDYQALPVIYSAADVGYYAGVLGTNGFYLSSALCCGTPMIISGEKDNEVIKNLGIYIQIDTDSTPAKTVKIISESLTSLLENPSLLAECRDRAMRNGRSFTWDSVAKVIKNSFISLQEQLFHETSTLTNFPSFFSYHYDTIHGKTTPAAYERPAFIRENVDVAIAKELIQNHSVNQVSAVLRHICKDEEIVKKMPTYLTAERKQHE